MRHFITISAALLVAACGGGAISERLHSRQNVGLCPPAGALYQASRIVEFKGEGADFASIEYTGEIVDVRLLCRYAEDDPVRAQIEVDFAFGRGVQGEDSRHDYGYWVAVTRPSGKVLNKVSFVSSANFGDNNITSKTEQISRIVIPRIDGTISAANFEILVGFELTDDQLAFNQEGRRFRLDAGN